jgi:hypothetical protein
MPPRKSAAQRFLELQAELQRLEVFCKGTVLCRTMKCGRPNCACHTDPRKRHGPYWEWTYKSAAKTVNVRLSPAAAPLYQAASRQYRHLRSLLNRMEQLSRKALAEAAKQAESQANAASQKPSTARRP